jgi:two-component system, NtrC family, nitrogen regulation response regulator NtrX
MTNSILVVEDDPKTRAVLECQLREAGYDVSAIGSAEKALEHIDQAADAPPHLLLLDVRLGGMSGVELVRALAKAQRLPATVIISGEATMTETVEALRLGVYDFLEKPFPPERLLRSVENALEHTRLTRELRALRDQSAGLDAIRGNAPAIAKLRSQIAQAAPTEARVLIAGESGAGKELVANALHVLSGRSRGPFVKVNCAAIPATLIEDELFGHVAGAFTDARRPKAGLFEEADGGTLFLDEISEMDPSLQARLLRVLEDAQVRRLGDTHHRRVDVRVLSASNRDLTREIQAGRFRNDLYYRLAQLGLSVPPLRERGGDVALLFWHFFEQACRRHRVPQRRVEHGVLDRLTAYAWPGNVRELKNLCERLAVFGGDPIRLDDLPSPLLEGAAGEEIGILRLLDGAPLSPLAVVRAQCEKEYIEHTLRKTGWNFAEAARALDLQRTYLHRKTTDLGIHRPEQRQSEPMRDETPQ